MQRGTFDFTKTLIAQRAPDRLDNPGPLQEAFQHTVGISQIDVAHPVAQLRIGQAMMLFRWWFERLAKEMKLFSENRDLACLCPPQLPIDADDVAEVKALGELPIVVTDLVLADKQLYLTRCVLDIDKPQLAGRPLEADASCGAHARARHLDLALLAEPLAEVKIVAVNLRRQVVRFALGSFPLDFACPGTDVTYR